jgi:polyisoprenyl-teichoic acid--peptidoglycan teichoic acid transferase
MLQRVSPKIVLLTACLIVAAMVSLLFVDPWGWFKTAHAVDSVGDFPGVVEPSLYPDPQPLSNGSFNILILGLDHGLGRTDQGNNRTDVIMIAHVDEKRAKTCLISIPRDSYIDIAGFGRTRANEAFEDGGSALAMSTFSQLTGLDISKYVALDFDEFRDLVNLFGGFQITLNEPLLDPKLGTIPSGNVFLNGDNALVLARSRNYANGDLERVRQQQRIITQLLYKGKDMAGYPGAAWFLRAAIDRVETNLSLDDLIRLCREFASFPVVDIQGGVVPGKVGMAGSASVYLVDMAGLQRMIQSVQTASVVPDEFR